MSSPIPKLGVEGTFVLRSPFKQLMAKDTTYKVTAIRRFIDFERNGVDVYLRYYAPYQLAESDYQKDAQNSEVIVSLECGTNAPIYVPTSYIQSFPSADTAAYHHVVLGVDLGLLPDNLNLTALVNNLKSVSSDVIGATPTITTTLASFNGTITMGDKDTLEANRQAKIKNRTTDYVRAEQYRKENETLQAKIKSLETYVRQLKK